MKFKNVKNLFEPIEKVISYNGEDIVFSFVPLPINFDEKIESIVPTPEAPKSKEPLRDSKGKFLRDEKGFLMYETNVDDKHYKKMLRETQGLQTAAMIYESLKHDKNIDWNVGEYKDTLEFYKKLRDSILENIPIGLYSKIIEKINEVSTVSNSAIDDAKKN